MGNKCSFYTTKNILWKIEIPTQTSLIQTKQKSKLNKVKQQINKNINKNIDKNIKFLQLTDIHYDPLYLANSKKECDKPLCCEFGIGNSLNDSAGKWGSYGRCDLPINTLENSLDHIANNHADLDYWLVTGDYVAHDIWRYTKDSNLRVTQIVTQLIKKYNRNHVLVVPVIGNHESVPVNR